jgi:hypothetical protein
MYYIWAMLRDSCPKGLPAVNYVTAEDSGPNCRISAIQSSHNLFLDKCKICDYATLVSTLGHVDE